jgi:hypothetical protein
MKNHSDATSPPKKFLFKKMVLLIFTNKETECVMSLPFLRTLDFSYFLFF